jgi:16S rRNA (uracil1498-N3)-methyltransferase
MHRILVETSALSAVEPTLTEQARRHLKVVRPKEGEPVELFDGKGRWRLYSFSGGNVVASGEICSDDRAERPVLVLFACVTKGSRWDWTIEKATELGVTRVVPVISDRTIVRIPAAERNCKRERWFRIAEDAARQSDAKWLPDVVAPVDFAEAVAMAGECDCYVGALTDPAPPPMLAALESARPSGRARPLAVFVGPEGDFTPEELSSLLAVSTPVSFGPTILRAETAAIYGLGVAKAWMDSHEV